MFDPILADKRFGCGLSPKIAPPQNVNAVLEGLTGADKMAEAYPIGAFQDVLHSQLDLRAATRLQNKNRNTPTGEKAAKAVRKIRLASSRNRLSWMATHIARWTHSPTPFRERLDAFWADHFSTKGKQNLLRAGVSPYRDEAIRPHLTGHFADLLFSAVTHPMMVHFLDQDRSFGPNSTAIQKRKAKGGLNENLAREILELHTLGVNGSYSQTDVRELAKLLTGLTYSLKEGHKFRPEMSEPGAERILGQTYGGDPAELNHIHAFLSDVSIHPDTALHISEKLARYFVRDDPAPDLVRSMADIWRETDGHLLSVYKAMLDHPMSWGTEGGNVKQPFDFVASAFRALDMPAQQLIRMKANQLNLRIYQPLKLMGQHFHEPNGPDGIEEADSTWITPQSMAVRLQWSIAVPRRMFRQLPDPRVFVETALGPDVPESVRFAAGAAESRPDGVGLVLASPAFQRM